MNTNNNNFTGGLNLSTEHMDLEKENTKKKINLLESKLETIFKKSIHQGDNNQEKMSHLGRRFTVRIYLN